MVASSLSSNFVFLSMAYNVSGLRRRDVLRASPACWELWAEPSAGYGNSLVADFFRVPLSTKFREVDSYKSLLGRISEPVCKCARQVLLGHVP